jgi:zinc transporter, ZIP family
VGVVPVSLGLLWYPFLRRLGTSGMNFVLALTVGLLVFLVLDTLLEALEVAGQLPGVFSGIPLVILLTLLTLLGLMASGRLFRRGSEEASRLGTSYRIALGIGLHNLGEGLAIGAAFALGEVALGVFLVIGFTLHNITEGVGIAAPILKERPRYVHFVWLALLGGGPAILGTWIAGFAYSPLLSAIFLAVGAGAILQVIHEVTRLLLKDSARAKEPVLSASNLGGLTAGIAVMYATALLVSV